MTVSTSEDPIRRAFALHRAGQLVEAASVYRHILADDPDHPDALHLLGTLEYQNNRLDEAQELISRAVVLAPKAAEFHAALGQVLFAQLKIADAIAAYRHSLSLRHDMPDVHYNLGSALLAIGEHEPAAVSLHQAALQRPNFPDAFNNLGSALRAMGKLDEAVACYRQALAQQPQNTRAWVNLGQVLKTTGDLDGSIASFDRAVALDPKWMEARSGKIYTLYFHPSATAEQILIENLLWNQWHAKPLRGIRRAHANDRSPGQKLRVGYVSPDFRDHVAGLYLLPLLRGHDRERFDVYCYSNVYHTDAITEQFVAMSRWRDIHGIDDERAEQIIRDDRIDILIDTTLHMGGNRLPLFARKPAPIQVTICGYPGTTGLETMDYRLTDPYLDPAEADDAVYAERSVRLPDTFWCYAPLEEEPAVGPLPCLTCGHVTFGCLNNFCKVNDAVLVLWAKATRAVEGSRLLLLAPEGSARSGALQKFAAQGIDASRIEFIDFQPRRQYLETYHRIDISLDTSPYNGHTTSLDSFWMGVPVVTLVGNTAVGRAGWSQLSNLNLPELAARDAEQFTDIVVKLVEDKQRLGNLRRTLRGRMGQSPLMDAEKFTRSVEAAYQTMWDAQVT